MADENLYLITQNSPCISSCFIVDVSWHVSISDKIGLVAAVILADGCAEGLWEQYCLNIATFALTTETHR